MSPETISPARLSLASLEGLLGLEEGTGQRCSLRGQSSTVMRATAGTLYRPLGKNKRRAAIFWIPLHIGAQGKQEHKSYYWSAKILLLEDTGRMKYEYHRGRMKCE
jgi:hypothetical protein